MKFAGNPVSSGIGIGSVYIFEPIATTITTQMIDEKDVEAEVIKFNNGRERAFTELQEIYSHLSDQPDKRKIIQAHIDILHDEVIEEDIIESIGKEQIPAKFAVQSVFSKYQEMLLGTKDELIQERVSDLKDVMTRLLRCIDNKKERSLSNINSPVVLIAHDLYPSDTATLNPEMILGIVTEVGGSTSHTAIIARSYGIPAVLGVNEILENTNNGDAIIVDGIKGDVILQPDQDSIAEYKEMKKSHLKELSQTARYLNKPGRLKDGIAIEIDVNIGSDSENELKSAEYTDGVGLFRTEFLYMKSNRLPTEEEQMQAYTRVLKTWNNKPVIIRTLDIGGDKQLDCINLPEEGNPFLGKRALRLCFDEIGIFKTQLRALYRASIHGNLWIMLPMVSSYDDIKRALDIINSVKEELKALSIPYTKDTKIGIMIEVPSIALITDLIIDDVDFASIGSNDLCQYLTATDRMNPEVAEYYQSYHPAVFRIIKMVTKTFAKANKPVSICGELASEPKAIPILIGLGIRKLSVNSAHVASIKKIISELDLDLATQISNKVLNTKSGNP